MDLHEIVGELACQLPSEQPSIDPADDELLRAKTLILGEENNEKKVGEFFLFASFCKFYNNPFKASKLGKLS